ncbi:MAG: hypothetical protein PHQ23_09980, partial [Candidatus Wallbacteria bacterium]|nr:hypothetical protein [Candidatus Wallbacteria bacterium]
IPVLAIPGEFDSPLSMYESSFCGIQPFVKNLHQAKFDSDEFSFFGYGGRIIESDDITPEEYFVVQYPYNMLKYKFRKFKYSLSDKIIVLGTPPTISDSAISDVEHYCCRNISELAVEIKPKIIICKGFDSNGGIDFVQNAWLIQAGHLCLNNFVTFDTTTQEFIRGKFKD